MKEVQYPLQWYQLKVCLRLMAYLMKTSQVIFKKYKMCNYKTIENQKLLHRTFLFHLGCSTPVNSMLSVEETDSVY